MSENLPPSRLTPLQILASYPNPDLREQVEENVRINPDKHAPHLSYSTRLPAILLKNREFMEWYASRMNDPDSGLLTIKTFPIFFNSLGQISGEAVREALKAFAMLPENRERIIALWDAEFRPATINNWISQ